MVSGAVWLFVLVIAPIVAVAALVLGLAWNDRHRRRKAIVALQADAPSSSNLPRNVMRAVMLICLLGLLSVVVAARQQSTRSSGPAKDLVTLLSSRNQSAIAAKDPETGGFVAALLYPGVQLLVVSAKPPEPVAVEAQLAANNFQEVYAALQDAGARTGRLFVQDLGADGLNDSGESVDVVYDEGRQTLFDGNPRAHKMNEKTYREAFAKADARYARMIGLLLERSKQLLEK